ncbi:glycoside hydrolase family 43 protein [Rudanella lutea]|uniref:glycoside hydrolase family 43 protein n=1 Tax=Rudanella lutea TaxID=451374 RepID=UPI000365DA55|nr:glycoside hydrolase family 43 protein [Rudanella lutea]
MKVLLCWLVLLVSLPTFAQRTFTNPIKASGPDPWVYRHDGCYYYMNTTGRNLTLWRTRNVADLATAEQKVVFTPPPNTAYSRDLWAPEIHRIGGKWYIYFAADSVNNQTHRIWVVENASADPFAGEWVLKGKLADPGDHWAIDLTVLEHRGKLYAAWSGWAGAKNGQQDIYIAQLKNPWTMQGDRVRISQPELPWERHGHTSDGAQMNGEPPVVLVNEGPEFLQNGNKTFIVYSANACWLDYCMGLLEHTGGSLLDPKNWRKHPQPVFTQNPENSVWAPGHGGFFTASDGRTPWMIYHANPTETDGCGNRRAPHIQPFSWNPDGSPNFGKPVPKTAMAVPE